MTLEDMRSRVEVMRAYSQEMAKKKRHTLRTLFIGILIPVVVVLLVVILFVIVNWLY